MNKILIGFTVMVIVGLGYMALRPASFGGVTNYLDTSANTITHATTSVSSATTTRLWASVTKVGQVINNSTGVVTCVMSATGTTAPSTTVTLGNGIVIPPQQSSTPLAVATFGECYPGSQNCYAHKGAVLCAGTPTATITFWSK